MNTSLNFTLEEIRALDNSVNDTRSGINSTINAIENCLNELKTNISGTDVHNSMSSISNSINAVNGKMNVAFQQLSDFLNKQMKSYATTYQNANANLKQTMEFINNNF